MIQWAKFTRNCCDFEHEKQWCGITKNLKTDIKIDIWELKCKITMDQGIMGQNHFINQMTPRLSRQKHNLTKYTDRCRKQCIISSRSRVRICRPRGAQKKENHFGSTIQVCPGERLVISKHQKYNVVKGAILKTTTTKSKVKE